MKKLLALILVFGLVIGSNAFAESPDLKSMSSDELQELIVQSLLEMCSREEWVNKLSPTNSNIIKNLFGKGISLIFRDTKENYYFVWLHQNDIELNYLNAIELLFNE